MEQPSSGTLSIVMGLKWSEKNGIIIVNLNKLINLLYLNYCWNMKYRNSYGRKMHAGSVITIFLYLYLLKANLLLFTNLFLDFKISETWTHCLFVIQVYHLLNAINYFKINCFERKSR